MYRYDPTTTNNPQRNWPNQVEDRPLEVIEERPELTEEDEEIKDSEKEDWESDPEKLEMARAWQVAKALQGGEPAKACFQCGGLDHFKILCPKKDEPQTALGQMIKIDHDRWQETGQTTYDPLGEATLAPEEEAGVTSGQMGQLAYRVGILVGKQEGSTTSHTQKVTSEALSTNCECCCADANHAHFIQPIDQAVQADLSEDGNEAETPYRESTSSLAGSQKCQRMDPGSRNSCSQHSAVDCIDEDRGANNSERQEQGTQTHHCNTNGIDGVIEESEEADQDEIVEEVQELANLPFWDLDELPLDEEAFVEWTSKEAIASSSRYCRHDQFGIVRG